MTIDIAFYKAYLCDCDCAWTADYDQCWFCGKSAGHKIVALSKVNPKVLFVDTFEIDPFRTIGAYSNEF